MLSLNECFGGAEVSLVLTQEGPVDSQSGHRVQGRRRHKIAPQILFRVQCCGMEIAVRERGHPYGALAHPGSPPAWRNASSRSEIACLSCATAAVFSSIFVLVSVRSCRLYCSLIAVFGSLYCCCFKLYSRCRMSSS